MTQRPVEEQIRILMQGVECGLEALAEAIARDVENAGKVLTA